MLQERNTKLDEKILTFRAKGFTFREIAKKVRRSLTCVYDRWKRLKEEGWT